MFVLQQKQTHLIRMYYYYGIMTTVAACLTFLVVYENQFRDSYLEPFAICVAFSGFGKIV